MRLSKNAAWSADGSSAAAAIDAAAAQTIATIPPACRAMLFASDPIAVTIPTR
jgi:hypothetical protein